jgi:hypothetical protein
VEYDSEALKKVAHEVYKTVKTRMAQGQLRPHVGMQGHLVLMLDKLERVLMHQENVGNELLDMAADALVAVYFYSMARMAQSNEDT